MTEAQAPVRPPSGLLADSSRRAVLFTSSRGSCQVQAALLAQACLCSHKPGGTWAAGMKSGLLVGQAEISSGL